MQNKTLVSLATAFALIASIAVLVPGGSAQVPDTGAIIVTTGNHCGDPGNDDVAVYPGGFDPVTAGEPLACADGLGGDDPTQVIFDTVADAVTFLCVLDAENASGECGAPDEPDSTDPSATISASPSTILEGETVNFTINATDDTGITTWSLDFGDNTQINETTNGAFVNQTVSHVYASAGSYQANFTVGDAADNTHAVSAAITVNVDPLAGFPTMNFVADQSSGLAPLDVLFTVDAADNGTISAWFLDFGDGSQVNQTTNGAFANASFGHKYNNSGSYTATFNVTDNNGNSVQKQLAIAVSAPAFEIKVVPASLVVSENQAAKTYVVNITKVLTGSQKVVLNVTHSALLNVTIGGQPVTNITFNATTATTGFTVSVAAPHDADALNVTNTKITHIFNASASNVSGPVSNAVVTVDILDDENDYFDRDGDGHLNKDDAFPDDPTRWLPDADLDGVTDASDNCPTVPNASQTDTDGDGDGNACDTDDDNDGVFDGADAFPLCDRASVDTDGDGRANSLVAGNGKCPSVPEEDLDDDGDGVLDVDDDFPLDATKAGDRDGDGIDAIIDNCPSVANANQLDTDGDGIGDACDLDDDGDGVQDATDAFPLCDRASRDTDGDGKADTLVAGAGICATVPEEDLDDDNDGVDDLNETADGTNPLLADTDGDGLSDGREKELGTNPLDASDPLIRATGVTVEFHGSDVHLHWNAPGDSELIDKFIVWRFSDPTKLGEVDYVIGQTEYEFVDTTFPGGAHYYAVQVILTGAPETYDPAFSTSSPFIMASGYFDEICPVGATDTDEDGLCDDLEEILGTNSTLADTDGDGFNDGEEILNRGSNPLDGDSVGSLPASSEWYAEIWLWVGLAITLAILGVVIYGLILFVSRPSPTGA